MNIYKVIRTDRWGWDEFDSFVCYAESAEQAAGFVPHFDTGDSFSALVERSTNHWEKTSQSFSWTDDPDSVKVKFIGEYTDVRPPKLILCSFNAG